MGIILPNWESRCSNLQFDFEELQQQRWSAHVQRHTPHAWNSGNCHQSVCTSDMSSQHYEAVHPDPVICCEKISTDVQTQRFLSLSLKSLCPWPVTRDEGQKVQTSGARREAMGLVALTSELSGGNTDMKMAMVKMVTMLIAIRRLQDRIWEIVFELDFGSRKLGIRNGRMIQLKA